MSAIEKLEIENIAFNAAKGPIQDPFYGKTLELNFLGATDKFCSFDCIYCDLGPTKVRLNKVKSDLAMPEKEQVLAAISEVFKRVHTSGPAFDTIIISGNGEPTLHPDFDELIKGVMASRDLWMPGKKIGVRTNGANLDSRKVLDALNLIDYRIVKVDAGSDRLFKIINSPLSRTNLTKVINGIKKLKDVVIQSMFVGGPETNTLSSDVDEWIEVIAILKPSAVHVQGASRMPAKDTVIRCDEDVLYRITSLLERRAQIRARVTP